ncbi:MAG TPA: ATP synthase F0 subunit C [Thermomicrobiales bacterium]|jgi:F-type H+-transporting ATPase subunit c|nr:ATP synthase F0 subunit C [Thermomicrobiales bacterium]
MDVEGARLIGAGLAIGLGAIGPGVGVGLIVKGTVETIGRNPDAAGQLQTLMYIGVGLTEAIAIYALVITILILFAV